MDGFNTLGSGLLTMNNPSDLLVIAGNASFKGGDEKLLNLLTPVLAS